MPTETPDRSTTRLARLALVVYRPELAVAKLSHDAVRAYLLSRGYRQDDSETHAEVYALSTVAGCRWTLLEQIQVDCIHRLARLEVRPFAAVLDELLIAQEGRDARENRVGITWDASVAELGVSLLLDVPADPTTTIGRTALEFMRATIEFEDIAADASIDRAEAMTRAQPSHQRLRQARMTLMGQSPRLYDVLAAALRLRGLMVPTAAPKPREPGPCKCCDRGDEYNGFGSDGPRLFDCPRGCACHD